MTIAVKQKVRAWSGLCTAKMVIAHVSCSCRAGIGKVVFGCPAEVLGAISGEELDVDCRDVLSSGILHSVDVVGPVCGEKAAAQHRVRACVRESFLQKSQRIHPLVVHVLALLDTMPKLIVEVGGRVVPENSSAEAQPHTTLSSCRRYFGRSS